jgi:alpha-glucosidase
VAAMLLLTLRGTPFVYMGDEIGQADGEIPPDRVVDIDGRDPERTPVQWDGTPGAGFGGDPWLPVGREAARVNVAAQRDDPASMFGLYRRLIWYRKGSAALDGDYRSLADTPGGCYAYLRGAGDERLLVALNFTGEPLEYQVDGPGTGRLEVATDPARPLGDPVGLHPLRLGPDEGVVVRL